MSELKVLVDGKEREIRGVSEDTTCENIILVLAEAAGKNGKVALLERWQEHERILPPDEYPMRCLQSWGALKHEVSLVLQDESPSTYNHLNKTSINLSTDDKSDLIKRSLDCESQENFTAFQQRKLQRLARAIEILDLQCTCWKNNEEAFLFLTEEEIVEDLSVKLGKALKLQAKELVELETWENELHSLEQTCQNLSKQREIFGGKISKLEEQIAEAYDAVEMLLEDSEQEENSDKERRYSQSALVREELEIISRELSQQNALFRKQDLELNSINSSMSDLETSIESKNNTIRQLKTDIESCDDDISMSENFLPKTPEAESTKCYENDNNIGLSENYIEPTSTFEGKKFQGENNEIQSSNAEIETVAEIEQDNVIDGYLEQSSYKREEPLTSEKPLQKSIPTEKANRFPSSLSKFNLMNGVDELETNSNSEESKDAPNLENVDNCSNLDRKPSEFSKELRVVSPEAKPKSSEATTKSTSSLTKYSAARPYKKPSSQSTAVSSKRKESFKKIRDVFEKQIASVNSNKKESTTSEEVSKNTRKPPTLPKPTKNKVLPPQLENTVLTLEEKWNTENSAYSSFSESRPKLVTVPKPYGSYATNIGMANVQDNSKSVAKSKGSIAKSLGLNRTQNSPKPFTKHSKISGVNSIEFQGMNITEAGTSRIQETLKSGINAKDHVLTTTQDDSKIIATTTGINSSGFVRTQGDIKYAANSYGIYSAKHRTTTMESQPLLAHSQNSRMQDDSNFIATTSIQSQRSLSHNRKDDSKVIDTNFGINTTELTRTDDSNFYGIHSAKLTTTSMLSEPSLSHSQNSRMYLSPPSVSKNRRRSTKNNIISNSSDSMEHGVFV